MSDKRAVITGQRRSQQLKDLIARGKEQGYLTYAEVNDHLPNDIVDPEQIEDIVNMINDMGIFGARKSTGRRIHSFSILTAPFPLTMM